MLLCLAVTAISKQWVNREALAHTINVMHPNAITKDLARCAVCIFHPGGIGGICRVNLSWHFRHDANRGAVVKVQRIGAAKGFGLGAMASGFFGFK